MYYQNHAKVLTRLFNSPNRPDRPLLLHQPERAPAPDRAQGRARECELAAPDEQGGPAHQVGQLSAGPLAQLRGRARPQPGRGREGLARLRAPLAAGGARRPAADAVSGAAQGNRNLAKLC